ncbi:hypothetical protein [Pseudomonas koreensis]|jgi:hypothetical protein|uniref:hypothetical protein n=1 Tax=Pseudomonas koreensis TaxID=198620 RepID=UPI0038053E1F
MDIGQAFSMFHVGAINGARISERIDEGRSTWSVQFDMAKQLPSHLSTHLETARGGKKIFKTIEAALSDLKTIGLEEVTVTFSKAEPNPV